MLLRGDVVVHIVLELGVHMHDHEFLSHWTHKYSDFLPTSTTAWGHLAQGQKVFFAWLRVLGLSNWEWRVPRMLKDLGRAFFFKLWNRSVCNTSSTSHKSRKYYFLLPDIALEQEKWEQKFWGFLRFWCAYNFVDLSLWNTKRTQISGPCSDLNGNVILMGWSALYIQLFSITFPLDPPKSGSGKKNFKSVSCGVLQLFAPCCNFFAKMFRGHTSFLEPSIHNHVFSNVS